MPPLLVSPPVGKLTWIVAPGLAGAARERVYQKMPATTTTKRIMTATAQPADELSPWLPGLLTIVAM